ncbi:MAG: phage tail assembly chaperone [Alphaproteobacteria bacterium]|nr:phage tail assembly chaperone [Alphaproteobacteria bacterium]MBU1526856.1 phage tail assembly chaperone [Alphaproteobacteria bacterium]MBU2351689.1 phage tail assembly chaperone [Alphaproteobacteria bacterium]MBU2382573.1 phage tail assembly chaperone [Alphaproteobacteria bacterium]
MLRTALAMGVQPEAFWRLSLKEWRMLTERGPEPTLGRGGLEALMARWPDQESPSPEVGRDSRRGAATGWGPNELPHPGGFAAVPPHDGEGEREP